MSDNIVKPCTILFIFTNFIMLMWEEDGKLESGMVDRPKDKFEEGDIAMCSMGKDKAGHWKPVSVFKKRGE
jgi:UPF0288 family protein (methanogenesis marker protein 3)